MFKNDYGIILSLDVSNIEKAKSIAKLSLEYEEIVGYKIGFTLGLRFGLPCVVKALKEVNPLPVIYDHQKAGTDIPQMGEPFARCCKESGMDSVIIFSQAGPKTLHSFISSIESFGMIPIVGGVMTHSGYLASDGGYILDEAPENIFQEALSKGVSHFVLPGNKPELIERYSNILNTKKDVSVIMPGIGSQGGDLLQAFSACKGIKPYAIIGSAIYKAEDPSSAIKPFLDSVLAYKESLGKIGV